MFILLVLIFLFYYLAVAGAECAGGIRFIGIDVHGGSELVAYADYNIAENETALGIESNAYDFLVGNAEVGGSFGREMNMTLCGDNTFAYFIFSCGTYELAAGRACNIARFANRRTNTESSGIRESYLNLTSLSFRTEDYNICNLLFGTHNGYSLLAGILTGLTEGFLYSELIALAEKCLHSLCCKMNMSCRGFNQNFIFHRIYPFRVRATLIWVLTRFAGNLPIYYKTIHGKSK